MPSPVGHALGGVIIGLLGTSATRSGRSRTARADSGGTRPLAPTGPAALWHLVCQRSVWLPTVAAVAPDLDFLWGRHNMETHSLGAALLAAAVVLLASRGRDRRLAVLVGAAWASHVLFDWLGSDTTPPLGVMALWPASDAFYFADAFVFEAISRRTHLPNFWTHNVYAVAREIVTLGPLALLAAWWRRRRRRPSPIA